MKNYLSTSNAKMKETGKHFATKIASFDIPEYKDNKGNLTCPMAGICAKYCYAGKGFYKVYKTVSEGQHKRLELTKDPEFISTITSELNRGQKTIKYVRIHSAGDFYSKAYLNSWIQIAEQNPEVRFYAYTKSVHLFLDLKLPENFDITFSEGGKLDHKIDTAIHKHARIFDTIEDLKAAGYVDASKFDLLSTKWHVASRNIGLVFH